MKNIVIAPMGDNMDALFVGIKEFPTEKIINGNSLTNSFIKFNNNIFNILYFCK